MGLCAGLIQQQTPLYVKHFSTIISHSRLRKAVFDRANKACAMNALNRVSVLSRGCVISAEFETKHVPLLYCLRATGNITSDDSRNLHFFLLDRTKIRDLWPSRLCVNIFLTTTTYFNRVRISLSYRTFSIAKIFQSYLTFKISFRVSRAKADCLTDRKSRRAQSGRDDQVEMYAVTNRVNYMRRDLSLRYDWIKYRLLATVVIDPRAKSADRPRDYQQMEKKTRA